MPFFRFRSLDELRDDIAARGHDIALSDDPTPLFAPLSIGGRTASNRLLVHPMEGCDGNLDGTPGDLTLRRWQRFAGGGAAILWGEATAVIPEGRANPRQLVISPATLPGLRRLLVAARAARRAALGAGDGFLVGLQLTHSGRWSAAAPIVTRHARAIDAVRATAGTPVMGDDALEALEQRFEDAAVLARDAGFDFIDIKQCHTYLLNELLAGRDRIGPYGGDFDGRTRFVRNVFGRIRARLGDSIILATRMNVYDGVPWVKGAGGIGVPHPDASGDPPAWGVAADRVQPDLAEPLRLIGELRSLGLSMLNVSMGSPYFNPHIGRPFERAPVDGYTPPEHPLAGVERHFALTAAIQRGFPDLPVAGTGYSWLRHFALNAGAANAAAGAVTMVGLGRGALAYPDFASDALRDGALQRDKACIGVSYCTALMRAKHNDLGQYPTGCVPRDRLYADELRRANLTEGWR
jgi:2,4-dienoyl-CoA reductase-like NADH-dependent reductase (Old Yellow Enzyme family)